MSKNIYYIIFNFFSFIQISYSSNRNQQNYIVPLTNENFSNNNYFSSTYISEMIRKYHYCVDSNIGYSILTNINSNLIFADQSRYVNVNFHFFNSEVASGIAKLVIVQKVISKNKWTLENFNLFVHHGTNIIRSIDHKLTELNSEDETNPNYITCHYQISDGHIDIESNDLIYEIIDNFIKIEKYSFLVFGLDNNDKNLYLIKIEDNKVKTEKILEYIDFLIDDFFLIEQINLSEPLLAILSYKEKRIDIYSITEINEKNKHFIFKRRFMNIILKNNEEINQIGIIGTNYIVIHYANSDKLYYFFQNESLLWDSKELTIIDRYNTLTSPKKIKQFIIFTKNVYILYETLGIGIFYFAYSNLEPELFLGSLITHPNIDYIDYIINPFNSNIFLGVKLNQNTSQIANQDSEVFIEFLLNEEENPYLNKIFTSKNQYVKYYTKFINLDSFFSYSFNQITKNIIIIRRGMLNSIPFLTYVYPINLFSNNSNSLFDIIPLSDYTNNISIILLIDKINHKVVKVFNFTMPTHNMSCVFPEEGEYYFRFIQKGEVCSASINNKQKNQTYPTCQKILNYNYKVYKSTNSQFIFMFLSCLITMFVFMIFVIIYFFIKTSYCKKRKFLLVKVSQKEKNEVDKLYTDITTIEEDSDEDIDSDDEIQPYEKKKEILITANNEQNIHTNGQFFTNTYRYSETGEKNDTITGSGSERDEKQNNNDNRKLLNVMTIKINKSEKEHHVLKSSELPLEREDEINDDKKEVSSKPNQLVK